MNLAVLAATLVDVVDFFPVTLSLRREQVSVFLPRAGLLPVAAGFVRCGDDGDSAVLLQIPEGRSSRARDQSAKENRFAWVARFNAWFNRMFNRLLDFYERWVRRALQRPALTSGAADGLFVASLAIYPFLGLCLLPANRRRPVHSQREGPNREPESK